MWNGWLQVVEEHYRMVEDHWGTERGILEGPVPVWGAGEDTVAGWVADVAVAAAEEGSILLMWVMKRRRSLMAGLNVQMIFSTWGKGGNLKTLKSVYFEQEGLRKKDSFTGHILLRQVNLMFGRKDQNGDVDEGITGDMLHFVKNNKVTLQGSP